MKFHAIAGQPHYARHIAAVWRHLPDDVRGEFLTGPQATGNRLPRRDVVMVAGWQDVPRVVRQSIVYVEHGAGQSYHGDPRSEGRRGYAGGEHPDRVRWYLAPRQDVVDQWGRTGFVSGCPALDDLVDVALPATPTAAITFHWDARLCPESRSALDHYRPALPAIIAHLRGCGFDVIGHWHPRTPTARAMWRDLGVEAVADFDTVLRTAHCALVDNSSAMYELAALGRPVLALNAPWYRRHVEHGLRFWSHVPGWQVDGPEDLLALDVAGYVREDWSRPQREQAIAYTYGREPGRAGQVTAQWLVSQVG